MANTPEKPKPSELPTRPDAANGHVADEIAPAVWPEEVVIKWWEVGCDPIPDLHPDSDDAKALTGTYETEDLDQVRAWLDVYLLIRGLTGAQAKRDLIQAAMTTVSGSQFRLDALVFLKMARTRGWKLNPNGVESALSAALLDPLAKVQSPKGSPRSNGGSPTGQPSPPPLSAGALMTNRQRRQQGLPPHGTPGTAPRDS